MIDLIRLCGSAEGKDDEMRFHDRIISGVEATGKRSWLRGRSRSMRAGLLS